MKSILVRVLKQYKRYKVMQQMPDFMLDAFAPGRSRMPVCPFYRADGLGLPYSLKLVSLSYGILLTTHLSPHPPLCLTSTIAHSPANTSQTCPSQTLLFDLSNYSNHCNAAAILILILQSPTSNIRRPHRPLAWREQVCITPLRAPIFGLPSLTVRYYQTSEEPSELWAEQPAPL